jgi:ATP synthase protein I
VRFAYYAASAQQAMSDRTIRSDPWPSEGDAAGYEDFKSLTQQEAQALRAKEPPVSPWRVVRLQAVVGAVVAALVGVVSGEPSAGLSALYGAVVAVVPGALMARGMTSRFSSRSPGSSAVSFMLWEMVKIAVSVALLMLAPQILQPLSWPVMLVTLLVCIKVYWFALLWRGR